ncbi:MAG TPA: hypothetical protein PK624_04135 [Spirochaetota bacterium]|nr:hypothetical protein [Spirochaetota bacterium]HOR43964.1 hypothetical protein [Spirochaetota bacterium]HOU85482.1 hypothetical protein [Spirochaetota bacterium]HPK56827.1 hypothetical protein [Spirochaetota bacterium]HQE59698.1 hypothetical protein [Spirochaetota bacterium]
MNLTNYYKTTGGAFSTWAQGSFVPSYFFGAPMTAGTAATFKYMDSRKRSK